MKTITVNIRDVIPNGTLGEKPHIYQSVVSVLAADIDINGVIHAPVARKVGAKYELAVGHHRLAALKKLKRKTVELDVRKLTDMQMSQLWYAENESRKTKYADHYLQSWRSRWRAMDKDGLLAGSNLQNIRAVAESLDKQSGDACWVVSHSAKASGTQRSKATNFAALAMELGFTADSVAGRSVKEALVIVKKVEKERKRIDRAAEDERITQAKAEKAKAKVTAAAVQATEAAVESDEGGTEPEERAVVIETIEELSEKLVEKPKPDKPHKAKPIAAAAEGARKYMEKSIAGLAGWRKQINDAIRFAPNEPATSTELRGFLRELDNMENAIRKTRDDVLQKIEKRKLSLVKNKR